LTSAEFTLAETIAGIRYSADIYPNIKLDERFVLLLANTIKHDAIDYDQSYQFALRSVLDRTYIVKGEEREAFKAALGKMYSERREWRRNDRKK